MSDYYVRIDPALVVGFGDVESREANFLRVEYNPDIVLFIDHSNFNTFQRVVHVDGSSNFSRLTLGVSETAQFLSGSDDDTIEDKAQIISTIRFGAQRLSSMSILPAIV